MTPFLIRADLQDFDEYIRSLSKTARREYKKVIGKNEDITFEHIDFDLVRAHDFMTLWERQIVYGKQIKWPCQLGFFQFLAKHNKILCFCAKTKASGEMICLQFVEFHGSYISIAAPMYDKNKYLASSIAKFMLFNVIKYAVDHPNIKWVDLGAWGNDTWQDLVFRHKTGRLNSYKWQYIPRYIKENPALAEPYTLRAEIFNYKLYLGKKKNFLLEILYTLKWKAARFIYVHRAQRIASIRRKVSPLVTRRFTTKKNNVIKKRSSPILLSKCL